MEAEQSGGSYHQTVAEEVAGYAELRSFSCYCIVLLCIGGCQPLNTECQTHYLGVRVPSLPEVQYPLFALSTAVWLWIYLFNCSHVVGSSKKRLLARDGWSEIWKIVLLVSGDVERNPGPNYMTGIIILFILIFSCNGKTAYNYSPLCR